MASLSAGDIISIIALVRDVGKTLSSSKGSVAQFSGLERDLASLEDALLQADGLQLVQKSQKRTLRRTIRRCKSIVESFADELDKFQPYLRDGGSGTRVKDIFKRVQFGLTRSEAIALFRTQQQQHLHSIQIIIHAANQFVPLHRRVQALQSLQQAGAGAGAGRGARRQS